MLGRPGENSPPDRPGVAAVALIRHSALGTGATV